MAICPRCDLEMLDNVSCTPRDGAIPYGDETMFGVGAPLPELCHDCAAPKGALHHSRCDMEECRVCGRQLITCGHDDQPLLVAEEALLESQFYVEGAFQAVANRHALGLLELAPRRRP